MTDFGTMSVTRSLSISTKTTPGLESGLSSLPFSHHHYPPSYYPSLLMTSNELDYNFLNFSQQSQQLYYQQHQQLLAQHYASLKENSDYKDGVLNKDKKTTCKPHNKQNIKSEWISLSKAVVLTLVEKLCNISFDNECLCPYTTATNISTTTTTITTTTKTTSERYNDNNAKTFTETSPMYITSKSSPNILKTESNKSPKNMEGSVRSRTNKNVKTKNNNNEEITFNSLEKSSQSALFERSNDTFEDVHKKKSNEEDINNIKNEYENNDNMNALINKVNTENSDKEENKNIDTISKNRKKSCIYLNEAPKIPRKTINDTKNFTKRSSNGLDKKITLEIYNDNEDDSKLAAKTMAEKRGIKVTPISGKMLNNKNFKMKKPPHAESTSPFKNNIEKNVSKTSFEGSEPILKTAQETTSGYDSDVTDVNVEDVDESEEALLNFRKTLKKENVVEDHLYGRISEDGDEINGDKSEIGKNKNGIIDCSKIKFENDTKNPVPLLSSNINTTFNSPLTTSFSTSSSSSSVSFSSPSILTSSPNYYDLLTASFYNSFWYSHENLKNSLAFFQSFLNNNNNLNKGNNITNDLNNSFNSYSAQILYTFPFLNAYHKNNFAFSSKEGSGNKETWAPFNKVLVQQMFEKVLKSENLTTKISQEKNILPPNTVNSYSRNNKIASNFTSSSVNFSSGSSNVDNHLDEENKHRPSQTNTILKVRHSINNKRNRNQNYDKNLDRKSRDLLKHLAKDSREEEINNTCLQSVPILGALLKSDDMKVSNPGSNNADSFTRQKNITKSCSSISKLSNQGLKQTKNPNNFLSTSHPNLLTSTNLSSSASSTASSHKWPWVALDKDRVASLIDSLVVDMVSENTSTENNSQNIVNKNNYISNECCISNNLNYIIKNADFNNDKGDNKRFSNDAPINKDIDNISQLQSNDKIKIENTIKINTKDKNSSENNNYNKVFVVENALNHKKDKNNSSISVNSIIQKNIYDKSISRLVDDSGKSIVKISNDQNRNDDNKDDIFTNKNIHKTVANKTKILSNALIGKQLINNIIKNIYNEDEEINKSKDQIISNGSCKTSKASLTTINEIKESNPTAEKLIDNMITKDENMNEKKIPNGVNNCENVDNVDEVETETEEMAEDVPRKWKSNLLRRVKAQKSYSEPKTSE